MDVARRLVIGLAALALAAGCGGGGGSPGGNGGGPQSPSPSGVAKAEWTSEAPDAKVVMEPGRYRVIWRVERPQCPRIDFTITSSDPGFTPFKRNSTAPFFNAIVEQVKGEISIAQNEAACKKWSIRMERIPGQ